MTMIDMKKKVDVVKEDRDDDEWANALPFKKNVSEIIMSPIRKKTIEDDDDSFLNNNIQEVQPSSPTVISERKKVEVEMATNENNKTNNIYINNDNVDAELRRKQSSERIHARAIAAREALQKSKSPQVNEELDDLYERVVQPKQQSKQSSPPSLQAVTAKAAAPSPSNNKVENRIEQARNSNASKEEEEGFSDDDYEENANFVYLEKPKPMSLIEAEMFRDAKRVSLLMYRAENAFAKWN